MARRRRHEEHENHERWLVSYADFITLLFAFFVVMYSVSSVNEGKFRVLADSLVATFKDPKRSLEPIQVGELVRSPYTDRISTRAVPVVIDVPGILPHGALERSLGKGTEAAPPGADPTPAGDAPAPDPDAAAPEEVPPPAQESAGGQPAPGMAPVNAVADRIEEQMSSLIDAELIKVRRRDRWLEVELDTSILFASGEARLSADAVRLLRRLAHILAELPNPIQVEGFTDNVPIRTPAFPSNWELSAARAASVVHLFMKAGIDPRRMVAVGYGEHRPVADNSTPEGRRANRRVVLVIPGDPAVQRVLAAERNASAASAPLDATRPATSGPSAAPPAGDRAGG